MITKQEQFLWMVQTQILVNAINLNSRRAVAEDYLRDYSAMGAMAEAVYASQRIPENMDFEEAAYDFQRFMLSSNTPANWLLPAGAPKRRRPRS